MEISTGKWLKLCLEKIGKSNFGLSEKFSCYAPETMYAATGGARGMQPVVVVQEEEKGCFLHCVKFYPHCSPPPPSEKQTYDKNQPA